MRKSFLLLVLVLLPIDSALHAQGSISHAQITSFISQFSNNDSKVRLDAFYGLLDLTSSFNITANSYSIPEQTTTLLALAPSSDTDTIRLALINLLSQENVLVHASNQSFTGEQVLSEEYTDYYADLINVVVTLQDSRSIPALVGAITSGGTAVGALAAFGNASITAVLQQLSTSNEGVRGFATLTLIQMLDSTNFPKLSVPTIFGLQSGLIKAASFPESYIAVEAGKNLQQLDSKRVAVEIDIKPGRGVPSTINLTSKRKIPVAILSTPSFNALSIDTSTLTFGHTGYEHSLVSCNRHGEDANSDGLLDLVCHFSVSQTGFKVGDSKGILKGIAGTPGPVLFAGSGAVRIIDNHCDREEDDDCEDLEPRNR